MNELFKFDPQQLETALQNALNDLQNPNATANWIFDSAEIVARCYELKEDSENAKIYFTKAGEVGYSVVSANKADINDAELIQSWITDTLNSAWLFYKAGNAAKSLEVLALAEEGISKANSIGQLTLSLQLSHIFVTISISGYQVAQKLFESYGLSEEQDDEILKTSPIWHLILEKLFGKKENLQSSKELALNLLAEKDEAGFVTDLWRPKSFLTEIVRLA